MKPIQTIYHRARFALCDSSSSALKLGKLALAEKIISVKNIADKEKITNLKDRLDRLSKKPQARELSLSIQELENKVVSRGEKLRKAKAAAKLAGRPQTTSSESVYQQALTVIKSDPKILRSRWDTKLQSRVESMLYDVYADAKPKGMRPLNQQQKTDLMLAIDRARKNKNINVTPQNLDAKPFPLDLDNLAPAFDEFAYFISPQEMRLENDGPHSRIALTVDSHKARELVPFLADIVAKEPCIESAKIMGPDEQGNRTDSAIIYFNHADIKKANEISEKISQKIGHTLLPHTPTGMKCLTPGVSYSEFSDIHPDGGKTSSSHGLARAQILTSAIKSYARHGGLSVKHLEREIDAKFEKSGYNRQDNALLKTSSSERLNVG
ncbi:T3SS effector HopA1 family protein [Vibrio ostreicida]|uniref:T3SS effector HopA1 family protein n=1 Tax=Vibrio ostreicida TaxID=526588 RepID=UPI0009709D60|nr:T3SS effector HopA1 family protein [Vibrio ostreicida]